MLRLQIIAQGSMILDDSVVHERNAIFLVVVRMRVLVGLATMSGPACVRNADMATIVLGELCTNLFDAVACARAARGVLCGDEFRTISSYRCNTSRIWCKNKSDYVVLPHDGVTYHSRETEEL